MSKDEGTVFPEVGRGEVADYQISSSVLQSIVRWSLAAEPRVRLHREGPRPGRKDAEIVVAKGAGSVVVHLLAQFGEDLPALGETVKEVVASRLARMTGLRIARVDVHFDGVFPAPEDTA